METYFDQLANFGEIQLQLEHKFICHYRGIFARRFL